MMRFSAATLLLLTKHVARGQPLAADLIDAVALNQSLAPYSSFGILVGNATTLLYSRVVNGYNLSQQISVASSSKWVSQIIFSSLLSDSRFSNALTPGTRPSEVLPAWSSLPPSDPRAQINMSSLMSFTSGMNDSAPCANEDHSPGTTWGECALQILNAMNPLPYPPSAACPSTYYYGGSHQQLAAMVVVNVTQVSSFNVLFNNVLRVPLHLHPLSFYTPLSAPQVAGGLYISTNDYATILQAYFNGSLLPPDAVAQMEAEHTPEPPTCFAYAPFRPTPPASRGLFWHYGWGNWRECTVPPASFTAWQPYCNAGCEHSSIGKFGFYPYVDRCSGYWAVVSVPNGTAEESALFGESLWPAVRAAFAAGARTASALPTAAAPAVSTTATASAPPATITASPQAPPSATSSVSAISRTSASSTSTGTCSNLASVSGSQSPHNGSLDGASGTVGLPSAAPNSSPGLIAGVVVAGVILIALLVFLFGGSK